MKLKLGIVFFIFLFLFDCSSIGWDGTISPSNSDRTYFNPPTWIQGTWNGENINIKLTDNDFILNNVSYNERINILSTKYLNCSEQTTSTTYKITITHLSVNIDVYSFEHVSDLEVNCRLESGTDDNWDNRIIKDFTLTKT
jgi:hypothetical protein